MAKGEKVTLSFSLNSEQDRDILEFFKAQPGREKSKTFRDAMRFYMGSGSVTLSDLFQALGEIKRMLRSGALVANSDQEEDDPESDDPLIRKVESALDNLGL